VDSQQYTQVAKNQPLKIRVLIIPARAMSLQPLPGILQKNNALISCCCPPPGDFLQ
jgi:hypothetical protein